MISGRMADRYFEYLSAFTNEENHPSYIYQELLRTLFDTEFYSILNNDQNRIDDGLELRYLFGREGIDGPCSVLEMMVALSKRIESDIMFDPEIGDRTSIWFWIMIDNLGLEGEIDGYFDSEFVRFSLERLLKRRYEPSGKGGLFYVKRGDFDMRKIEIWYQMNYFFNEFLGKK